MAKTPVHLIFEGAELSGKSYLMSLVYQKLEPKFSESKDILDGCVWINSDVGVFGTKYGEAMVQKYLEMAEILNEKNIILEKLHISEAVYQKIYNQKEFDFSPIEEKLNELNFKIVFTTFREDEELIAKRLKERVEQYPHYQRIAKPVSFYLKQQELYREAIKNSLLPYLEIDMTGLDPANSEKVLDWAS